MYREDELLQRIHAAGLHINRKYRVRRGVYAGEVVTIDYHNGFIGNDGTAWVIVRDDKTGAMMHRSSVEEFKSYTEEVPQ